MTMIGRSAGFGVFVVWLCAGANADEWDDDEAEADYKYAAGLMVTVEKSLYVRGSAFPSAENSRTTPPNRKRTEGTRIQRSLLSARKSRSKSL